MSESERERESKQADLGGRSASGIGHCNSYLRTVLQFKSEKDVDSVWSHSSNQLSHSGLHTFSGNSIADGDNNYRKYEMNI